MIEDGLFLALGFCVATIIAIALLPLVWARALRITRARLALAMPVSAAEIEAKHDGLRAQAAVAQRRLEQEVEREQESSARLKVELGERTVGLAKLEHDLRGVRHERDHLITENTTLTRAMREGEGQRFAMEKALHDAEQQREAAVEAMRRALDRGGDADTGVLTALLPKHESQPEDTFEDRAETAEVTLLKQRFDRLGEQLLARSEARSAEPAADEDLRQVIIALGDDALRLLSPPADDIPRPEMAGRVQVEARP